MARIFTLHTKNTWAWRHFSDMEFTIMR